MEISNPDLGTRHFESGRFIPELMLPAWFVADHNWKITDYNNELCRLLKLLPDPKMDDGSSPSEISLNPYDLTSASFDGPCDGKGQSIWQLLFDEEAQRAVEEMIAAAHKAISAIDRFNDLRHDRFNLASNATDDLKTLVDDLTNSGSSDDIVMIYAFLPEYSVHDRPKFLRAGVRIAPARGLRSRVPISPIGSPHAPLLGQRRQPPDYAFVTIVAAWRIALDWSKGPVKPVWYGMQPAIHDAGVQNYDQSKEIHDLWMRNVAGIRHNISEENNDIYDVLDSVDRLFSRLDEAPVLSPGVAEILSRDDWLSKRMQRWDKVAHRADPSQQLSVFRDAIGVAREFTLQHQEQAHFMTDFGDLFQLMQGELQGDKPEALEIVTPEQVQEIAEKFSRRKLSLLAWRKWKIPQELHQRPLDTKFSLPQLPIRFRSKALFQFTLFQLLDNAWKNASFQKAVQLTLCQKQENGRSWLSLQIVNEVVLLDVPPPMGAAPARRCKGSYRKDCVHTPAWPALYRIRGGNLLCEQCLRQYYVEALENCEAGTHTGRGLFMVKSVVEGWGGHVNTPKEIFGDWDTGPVRRVCLGYTVPAAEHSWEFL